MKVIYSTCFADPWIKVAQKLHKDYNYEPVYWVGYNFDDSKELVNQHFPKAIYHSYYDAWKCVFPTVIEEKFNETYIDIDFLKSNSAFELQAIKMMDRLDIDRYSFNFMERQRHFRKFIKYWIATINLVKPDMVISAVIPHRVYDYALYLLCKYYNIKYITFCTTPFSGQVLTISDIFTIGKTLGQKYDDIFKSNMDIEDITKQINEDIIIQYNSILNKNDLSRPYYMKDHLVRQQKSLVYLSILKKIFIVLTGQHSSKYFGKNGLLKMGLPTYHKQRNVSIENSKTTIFEKAKHILRTNRYKKNLRKYYESLISIPDLTKPYIIFFLHYQPEMTTCPSGDIFVDQLLCVEMLVKNLPTDYIIYVKEHPTQFYNHTEGHTGRIKEFYDDLAGYSQVRLVSQDFDSFLLIQQSKAVSTVTGTVGWEAIVLKKPVIIFGLTWYEKYNGVLRVSDEKSANLIRNFIEEFSYSHRSLMAYLFTYSKIMLEAYVYRGVKDRVNQSEKDCIKNICLAIEENTHQT